MPKTIQQKIFDLQGDGNCQELRKAQDIALDLLLKATKDDKWESFINFFVEEEPSEIRTKQLNRLRLDDDAASSVYVRRTVAYLLANSMCGCDTSSDLNRFIGDRLDVGIMEVTVRDLKNQIQEDANLSNRKRRKK